MSTSFKTASAPGRLPLVGHVLPLMRRPVEFLGSLARYGDLVEIRLGPTKAYVPCHPDLLRQVLMEDRTFDKGGPLFDRAKAIVGNGLGSCPHQDHRRQRRLVQPAFHRARMEQYAVVMQDEISMLMDSWQDGQEIDAFPVFYDLALRISLRTLFAGYTGAIDFDRFRGSFSTVLHHIVAQMFLPDAWKHVPTRANRRFREAMEHLDLTVGRIIAEYRQSGVDHGDLMSILVAPPEDGQGAGLTDVEVRDQVISLLLAASETVPACLAWATVPARTSSGNRGQAQAGDRGGSRRPYCPPGRRRGVAVHRPGADRVAAALSARLAFHQGNHEGGGTGGDADSGGGDPHLQSADRSLAR